MKVSDTKDRSRATWAIVLSLFAHLVVIVAYIALPWLRTLLMFVDMKKPQVKIEMGMPQFVDVMIEELKNAKPAAPQPEPEQEPQKEPEKPQDAVVVKPKNPDTYTEPVIPKSQPAASKPTSEPATLATSQPASEPTSIATTTPASKPTKAGGVPLVATGLVDSMPSESKWLVLLGTEQMRKSPRRDVLGYSMRNHVFTDGEPIDKIGLDALEDVDEVMLVTEDPWAMKNSFGFVLRFRGTQADVKKRMEETAQKNGTKLVSTKINGHEIWQWESEAKKPPRGHYAFAFLSSNTMVIAVPPVLQQFLAKKPADANKTEPAKSQPTSAPAPAPSPEFLSGVMTERGEAPAILFAVSDLGNTMPVKLITNGVADWGEYLGFIKIPPQPLYFRAAFEAKEAASASFDAAFLTEKDAVDAATSMNAIMPLLAGYLKTQKSFDVLEPIAKRVKFKVYGKTIRADVDLTQEEVEILLEGFEPIIKGEAPDEDEDEPQPSQPAKPPSKTTNPATNNQPSSQPL